MEKPMLWRIFAASLMISPIQASGKSQSHILRLCKEQFVLRQDARVTITSTEPAPSGVCRSMHKSRGYPLRRNAEIAVHASLVSHTGSSTTSFGQIKDAGQILPFASKILFSPEPTTSSPTESSLSPLEPDQKSNSPGVIGGITACFVVITIVLGVTVFLFRRHHIHIPCTCLTDKPSPLPDDFADPDYNYGEYAVVNSSTTATESASSERTTENVTYDSLCPDRDQHHYRSFYRQTNQNNGNKTDEHSYMVVYDSFESDQQTSGNGLSNAAYYDEIATKGSQNVETDDAEKNEKYKEDDQCYYNVKAGPGSTGPEIVYHKYAVLDPDVTGYNRQGQDCQENKDIAKSESSSTEFVRR